MDSEKASSAGDLNSEQQTLNDDASSPAAVVREKEGGKAAPVPPDASAARNGGFQAWLQVLSSFFIFFNVLGLLNTYGQFQTIYETEILKSETSSTIAWIGSVQFLVCYVTCIFTGPIWDEGRLRFLLGVGTVVMVFGLMMVSLCYRYYQFFLAQALVTGVGFGFVFMPASAIVPQWFSSRGPFAVGIATTGSSIGPSLAPSKITLHNPPAANCFPGAVIYPIMLKELRPRIGFPWTVRVIAFIVLTTMLFAFSLMRLRLPPTGTKRKLVDLGHLKDLKYLLSCLGFFIGFLGLYVFYYYIQLYAIQVSGTDTNLAFYLLTILNAGSFLGRLLPNYAAGVIGPINTQIIFAALSGILSFCLLVIRTTPGVVAFTAIYGFVSGPFVSLPIPVVTSLSPDKTVWGTRLGMSFAFIGFGVLIGEPAAGAILGETQNWSGLIVWCGVLLVASSVILTGARYAKVGLGLKKKA